MAVIPMWQVDRDQSMHTSKAAADKHDLMLEIGERFAAAILAVSPDLPETKAEAIGLFLSQHRDAVAKLCKGTQGALDEAVAAATTAAEASITPLRAAR